MTGNVMGNIIIVGDLFPVPSNFSRFSSGDIPYLIGDELCRLFKDASYRICNLEGALTDNPGKCEKTGPVLYAPTATHNAYKALGIDCCTLANNHITDAGSEGVYDTMKVLDAAGISHIGAGNLDAIERELIFDVDGLKIGLYNVAETMYNAPGEGKPGAFLYDELIVCRDLERLKRSVDYIIVIYHGGAEKFRYPSPQTRRRFHRMVDYGANMILSQHTHCVGSEEYYNGAYLLYGQGNFLFRSLNNEFTDTGLVVELQFEGKVPTVKKHLVRAVGDRAVYDENQDFSSFYERSARIGDEAFLTEQFKKYCLQELPLYLNAYKGKNLVYRVIGRFFPDFRNRLVKKSYSRWQMMFMLHSIRSEQNREIVTEGLETLLDDLKCNAV